MKVRVGWYLMAGSAPDADQFECDSGDVQARLREHLAKIPVETVGEIKMGLTAAMPEALRTHGTWTHSAGPVMIKVSRIDA